MKVFYAKQYELDLFKFNILGGKSSLRTFQFTLSLISITYRLSSEKGFNTRHFFTFNIDYSTALGGWTLRNFGLFFINFKKY